jgi:hypothetical protein
MKQNTIETGLLNAAGAAWIPPTVSFSSAPSTPATGSIYVFTDALFPGAAVGGGASLSTCRWSGSAWVPVGGGGAHGFGATFDGGDTPLSSGVTAYLTVPIGGTITAWNFVVDAGTCTVKIWKVARGIAKPTAANSINTAGLSITSGTALHSTVLTDFTTLIVANGDLVGIHLQACTDVQYISFGVEL